MRHNDRFQMPPGAKVVGSQGSNIHMQVSMPLDEDGFLGRQCPTCGLDFRMDGQQYDALPNQLELWCVYCGHHAEHSAFTTPQQRERLLQAARNLGEQLVSNALDDIFRGLSRSTSRRSAVSFSYKSKPSLPRPLPGINEERLIRVRTCTGCELRYAIFGEHRYCPVCGKLPAATIAFDALQADSVRLDALSDLPHEAQATLREQGVFTRNWVDTIENVVGVVEALADSAFWTAVANAEDLLRGKGNIFQRLDDMADLFVSQGYDDLRHRLGPEVWRRLTETWAARHLFTHNDGVVDDRYLNRVPTSTARPGQRLVISDAICRQALQDARALCTALTELTA
ncbi:hypothetical protein PV318_00135 [Streptomyces sp. ME02-6991-2B]|nr:hypothetical protein [Streptomyces sp. ME02-6991-2B]